MKCYIHIGDPKTATTTIQHFLDQNKDLLYDNNYFVDFFGAKHHHRLAVCCRDTYCYEEDNVLFGHMQIKSQEDLEELKRTYLSAMKELYRKNQDKKIVISSECLKGLIKNENYIKNLKNILDDIGVTEWKIIYYIREQADFAISLFSQSAKNGYIMDEDDILKETYGDIYDYAKTIRFFEKYFGKENIKVRLFDAKEFKNQSIIEDFLEAIDYDSNINNFVLPDNYNESLSFVGIQLLNEINKKEPRFAQKQVNPKNLKILFKIMEHFKIQKYQMPKDICTKMREKYKNSNEWVRENYFQNREKLFFEKVYNSEINIKIPKEELEKIANTMIELSTYEMSYVDKTEMLSKFSTFVDSLNLNMQYVIYGYGTIGKLIFDLYKGKYRPIIIDKNLADEELIHYPKILKEIAYDQIIISVLGREEEIMESLVQEYNISRNRFLNINI